MSVIAEQVTFEMDVRRPKVRVIKRNFVEIDQERSIEINMMRHLMSKHREKAKDYAKELFKNPLTTG